MKICRKMLIHLSSVVTYHLFPFFYQIMGSLINQPILHTVKSLNISSIIEPKFLREIAAEIGRRQIASMTGAVITKLIISVGVQVILAQGSVKILAHSARVTIECFSLSFPPNHFYPFHWLGILLIIIYFLTFNLCEIFFLMKIWVLFLGFFVKFYHVFVEVWLLNAVFNYGLLFWNAQSIFIFAFILCGLFIFYRELLNSSLTIVISFFSWFLIGVQDTKKLDQIFQSISERIIDQ